MSSDDDDYMSDKFLLKETEDVRPGIPKRKAEQRVLEQYKKKIKSIIPNKHEQEVTLRTEGLNTAIASTNKGFQMLAKMGYKTGESLGSKNAGIVEPIGINLKAGKGGLGKKIKPPPGSSPRKKIEAQVTKEMESSYRKAVQDKKNMQMIRKYYYRAQSSCLHLDQQNDISIPVREFFWPRKYFDELKKNKEKKPLVDQDDYDEEEKESEEEDDEEIEEETINEEVLEIIVDYLRETYFYCIYCAAKGTDEEDLNSFCPGSYQDHDLD